MLIHGVDGLLKNINIVGVNSKDLKVLMLCPKPLYPLSDGGCVAMHAIWEGLQLFGTDVEILTAYSYKHPFNKGIVPSDMKMEGVLVDTKPRIFRALKNLFSSRSYVLERFKTPEMETALRQKLSNSSYNVVQIENLYMAQYIPIIRSCCGAKIVVRPANVESEIWERLSKRGQWFKRWYFGLLSRRLAKEEVQWLNAADLVLPITNRDAELFRKMGVHKPVNALPVGVADTLAPIDVDVEYPSLFYIGAMNWQPNLEGMEWFLKGVWPMVHAELPDLIFYIAGRYMPEKLKNADHPRVVVMGEVEDAKVFMASKSVMVVPILSGSGIRIKIIEGMVTARPVITTTLGAEGLDYTDRENIVIADDKQSFAKAIIYAVKNREEMEMIGEMGRRLVLEKHDIGKITEKLIRYYGI